MELRRFRLKLDAAAPFGTPPTSGTLFGHLCWSLRARHGREWLQTWLDRLPQEPFALSDMLPANHLPRPLLPTSQRTTDASPDLDKPLKRRRLISLDAWRNLRLDASEPVLRKLLVTTRGGRPSVPPDPALFAVARLPHNRIDRQSGKTPEAGGGGLWFADDLWPVPARDAGRTAWADLYIRSSLPAAELEALLADIGEQGFGRDATLGRGRFAVEGSDAEKWLDDRIPGKGQSRMMSLSQGFVSANMIDARWQRFVLFGKVSRTMMTEGRRAWKLPLMLAQSGATFSPADEGPYGAWVTGVHQDDPAIGHNGFHLAIPYSEATP